MFAKWGGVVFVGVVGLFVGVSLALYTDFGGSPLADVDAELSQLYNQAYYYAYIEHIDTIFDEAGVDGQVGRVTTALAEGRIGMFECHTLAHDIGHYAGYVGNFERIDENLSTANLSFCGSGFIHGVEGELVNRPYPENIQRLHEFCDLVQNYDRYYTGCYHGAGHGFMENTDSLDEALMGCDLLEREDGVTLSHCYRGAYSQHAQDNINAGANPESLLAICAAQPTNRQIECAQELNGFGAQPGTSKETLNDYVQLCYSNANLSVDVQDACLKSVAWAATDILLSDARELRALPATLELSRRAQRVYIDSVYGTYIKTADYDSSFSWETFCADFKGETAEYCIVKE